VILFLVAEAELVVPPALEEVVGRVVVIAAALDHRPATAVFLHVAEDFDTFSADVDGIDTTFTHLIDCLEIFTGTDFLSLGFGG